MLNKYKLHNGMTVSASNDIFLKPAAMLCEYMNLFYDIQCSPCVSNSDISIETACMQAENYMIDIACDKIVIKASDLKGAIYAVSHLLQLADDNAEIEVQQICEKPYKEFRGMHLYLPARENIGQYKRILDLVAFLKMNSVIIETSGAVEYEKHPEINKTWEWFCHTADFVFPGLARSRSVQWSDKYWKDSIHTEHAGGSYLSKDEVRDIVSYAKSLGLEVIPEIQALSHSYYLTLAHREIAEVEDDTFPDSYCPLNEKSYELYFDVAEEIIDIFKPNIVSIGHDEVRILGQCPKCRQKTGHELLAYEINKLHSFYTQRGIKMMMWAEMLQDYINYRGVRVGGIGADTVNDYGFHYDLPATAKAIDSIPNDIYMLDWQYSNGINSDDCFNERGFKSMFGNLRGSRISDWDKRTSKPCNIGGEVSTWCVTDEKTFARDGIFSEAMFSAHILWNDDYDNNGYNNVCDKVIKQSEFAKMIMRRTRSPFQKNGIAAPIYTPGSQSEYIFDASAARCALPKAANAVRLLGDKLCGLPIDTNNIIIKDEIAADSLLFVHSAKQDMDFKPSHWFPDEGQWGIGTYSVLYDDGTLELANAIFGRSVGPLDFEIKSHHGKDTEERFDIDSDTGKAKKVISRVPTFGPSCQWQDSLLYETIPVFDDKGAVFVWEWTNPHPEKKIVKIKTINTCQNKEQSVILYGILSVNATRR